jgi:hypothetical protein
MKKTTLITLLSLAAFSIVDQRIASAITARAAPEPAALNRPVIVARLPAGLIVPAVLPAGVQDPMLLEAWIRVYQQQDPIHLWGNVTVSGRGLALYMLEHSIPLVWDTGNVCGNGSCSVLSCAEDRCTYDDGKPAPQGGDPAQHLSGLGVPAPHGGEVPSVAPIYVALLKQGDMPSLISTLAHEIFHRTQPFGPVRSTRFEEYWAFLIGARVSKSAWPTFGAFDPLNPEQLNLWLQLNGLAYYFQYPEYPAGVASRVSPVSSAGDPYEGLPPQTVGSPATR